MAQSAAPTFGPRDIYRSFRAERNVALHRVLKRLPDPFIVALIEGLEQADVITPGRLFSGERGGCAVGGLGNREIAQSLFVSLKTVEAHLSSVYRKLGVSARGQLAEAWPGGKEPAGLSR